MIPAFGFSVGTLPIAKRRILSGYQLYRRSAFFHVWREIDSVPTYIYYVIKWLTAYGLLDSLNHPEPLQYVEKDIIFTSFFPPISTSQPTKTENSTHSDAHGTYTCSIGEGVCRRIP